MPGAGPDDMKYIYFYEEDQGTEMMVVELTDGQDWIPALLSVAYLQYSLG